MKIWFVLGTAAELIKIYPVMKAAEARGITWQLVSTGQSPVGMSKQIADFSLPREQVLYPVVSENDLSTSGGALRWFWRAWFTNPRTWFTGEGDRHCVMVHGDTLSTLAGARWGNRLKVDVVHVEAGLRSPRLFSPFPEEINRRLVSRRARLHMAPDEEACDNLRKEGIRSGIVNTNGNTLADTLRLIGSEINPRNNMALVNIHRYENLRSRAKWACIQRTIELAAQAGPVTWVQHPQTRAKLAADPAWRQKLEGMGVTFTERLPFSIFIKLLSEAAYVISDGGSNQEECSYLGQPCLLMRNESERREGLGETCVLSKFNDEVIASFLREPRKYSRAPNWPARSPSGIVIDTLEHANRSF